MKFEIFLFFVCGFCFNIVAPFHNKYERAYRHGVYPQQNYPQNPSPVYPATNHDHYIPPQHIVQAPPETEFVQLQQEQETSFLNQNKEKQQEQLQQESIVPQQQFLQQVADSRSNAIYVEQPPLQSPPIYHERPRYYLAPPPPQRNYEPYGVDHIYAPNTYPPNNLRWGPRKTFQSSPAVPQEPYVDDAVITYPEWKSKSGYKAVPQQSQYYGSAFEDQRAYNGPAHYIQGAAEPQQAHAAAKASSNSESTIPQIIASKPDILDHLAYAEQMKKQYIILHENGTIEHVNVIDHDLLGKSQRFKSSDLKTQHKKTPYKNEISATTSLPENTKQSIKPNESPKNIMTSTHPQPIVPKESKLGALPAAGDSTKKHHEPRHNPYKMTNVNYNEGDSSITKSAANDNYSHFPVYKPALPEPLENYYNERNKPMPYTWDRRNNYPREQKHKTDIIFTVSDQNDKKYDNTWHNGENNKYYNPIQPLYPAKTNTEPKIHITKFEIDESKNYNNPIISDLSPIYEKTHYSNPSSNKYSNNPTHVHNTYDDNTNLAKDVVTTSSDNVTIYTDAPKLLDEPTTTALPYNYQSPSNKSDEIDTFTTILPSNNSYNDILTSQKPVTESYDDTSSNAPHYLGEDKPTTDKYNNDANNDDSSTDHDYSSINNNTDAYNNDDTVDETEQKNTDAQDTNNESVIDDDDEQIEAEPYTDIYDYPVTTDDYTTISPAESLNIHPVTDATDTYHENVEEIQNTQIINDESDSVDEVDENKVIVDFANLRSVSKSMFWFNPDDDFWDKLYLGNDTGGYDDLYIFNVKIADPVIEKTSKSYEFQNGTVVEETEEVIWDHKSDDQPREIKYTKIIKNPDNDRHGKNTSGPSKDAVVPKCKH